MKSRNILFIFFIAWFLLYAFTNPVVFCMEADSGGLLTPLTLSLISDPSTNDNTKELACYFYSFKDWGSDNSFFTNSHDKVLTSILTQQAKTPLALEIFQSTLESSELFFGVDTPRCRAVAEMNYSYLRSCSLLEPNNLEVNVLRFFELGFRPAVP